MKRQDALALAEFVSLFLGIPLTLCFLLWGIVRVFEAAGLI